MATYRVLPYSNEEFEASVRGKRHLGFSTMGSEKVEGRHVATRLGGPERLTGLLDMDLTVAALEPTPFRVELCHGSLTRYLVPDFAVRNVDGSQWCVHVAVKPFTGADESWVPQVATKAIEHHGIPLAIVSPEFAKSHLASGTKYVDYHSRATRLPEGIGPDVAAMVQEASDEQMSVRDLCSALVAVGWAERDEKLADSVRYWRENGEKNPERDAVMGPVFRAIREGYVDFDPRSRRSGFEMMVHPRLAFLEQRTVLPMLLRYLVHGMGHDLAQMAKSSCEAVRQGPSPLDGPPMAARSGI